MANDEELLDYLKHTAASLQEARQRVHELEEADREPIAIVGMGCRFPGGVASPEDLWELLESGTDVVTGFPEDRGWDLENLFDPDPDAPGRSYVREGGFLRDAARFDTVFFGISPREALVMDPQQRLLLECTWEAVERARLDPRTLRGSRTGVFVGSNGQDYGTLLLRADERSHGYLTTAASASVLSGRVSYIFGLEGPAVTVSTACSSSLVALHLAAKALRAGECELALAAGVTVMSTTRLFEVFSRQRGLAPDGRSKAFAASADGTGWGEGVGVLVLERLSDAQRNGRRILAVVRGSAVNQDGASNGLTAPNGPSQQRVLRAALDDARLGPAEVDAVEAHGTGTRLGDPIEAQALLAVYGQNRSADRPLWLGSVKSNIGHTQAAAGAAGVIKMVAAMHAGMLPQTLHVDAPTPEVDWSSGAVRLLTSPREWVTDGRPRRAGVSSFGISGTNAHVIIEEAPLLEPASGAPTAGAVPWAVSGRTQEALRDQAARLAAHVAARPDLNIADAGWSLVATRSAFEHRAVVVGHDRDELLRGLRSVVAGADEVKASGGALAFAFSGQGSQRPGMGLGLYERFPVFAAAFDEVQAELDPLLDGSLKDFLGSDQTLWAQAGLFAIEVALFRLVESWGLRPDFVVGHSIGEVAAAHVAGVWTLPDACRVVAARGRLMQALPSGGAMAVLHVGGDEAAGLLTAGVVIASVNSPGQVAISGEEAEVERVVATVLQQGGRARRLRVSHGFHSPLMEPMLDDFRRALAEVEFREPTLAAVSNVTGTRIDAGTWSAAEYWVRQVRETVLFADCVDTLLESGATTWLELGPSAALTAAISACAERSGHEVSVAPVLRANQNEETTALTALAKAYVNGHMPDWTAVFPDARTVDLPTYAFQHGHYWMRPSGGAAEPGEIGLADARHPLLGAAVGIAGDDKIVFTGRLSLRTHPWLADHMVLGSVLLPGTAFVELAVRAGDEADCPDVRELTLHEPLRIPPKGAVQIQVAVGAAETDGARAVTIHSRPHEEDDALPWSLHASGLLTPSSPHSPGMPGEWPPPAAQHVGLDGFYSGLAEHGYAYGPIFQGLRSVWKDHDEVFADVALPDSAAADAARFGVHPALLDAVLHAARLGDFHDHPDQKYLPFAWRGVTVQARGATAVRARIRQIGTDTIRLDATDSAGRPVLTAEALTLRPVPVSPLGSGIRDALFRIEWKPVPAADAPSPAVAITSTPETAPPADIIVVPANAADDVHQATHRALAHLQTWLATDTETKLAFLTRDVAADLVQAPVWGLVRTAQTEHPDRFLLIDTDDPDPSPETLAAALATGEPQIAIRDGIVLAPRLVPAQVSGTAQEWNPEGTVLITGGSGTLAGMVAAHAVERKGVRRIILASRSGRPAPGTERLDAEVIPVVCDVSDRATLGGLIAAIPPEHPLTAVVHTAGVLDDGALHTLTPDRIDTSFAAKVDGARHLHELTANLDLAEFVLFSSASAVLGSAGQGNYAAANAYLDALATHRRALGLPAVSLAWGLWAGDSGMTGGLGDTERTRISRLGVTALTSEEGMRLFDGGCAAGDAVVVPMRIDRATLRARREALPAPMQGLVPKIRTRSAISALGSVSGAERTRIILALVRTAVADSLGYNAADGIRPDQNLQEVGFDSLTAVELRNRLAAATGLRLPATLIYDHPSSRAIAEHVLSLLSGIEAGAPAPVAVRPADDDPIVIVGMAGRYPGGVRTPEDLWDLVVSGGDGISSWPTDRGWDTSDLYDPDPDASGRSYVREGGFLHDAGRFDEGFFGISPREALAMDPQQRLLLECSWEAIERAGIEPSSLKGSRTGVYVGVMYHDYASRLGSAPSGYEGTLGTGSAASIASGRISYTFDLVGPAVTVDTACSTSLVGLHLAAQALRTGECELALAGGVTVMHTPRPFVEFSRQRGLAPDGRSKAFAKSADGVAWSEGVGILVLERLSDARRLGHEVLAVVRGSAVNQDGASNGLTAPNGPSQQRVIRAALADARLGPSEVDVVEAHGTGTRLGDPIEAMALMAVYGQDRPADRPLWLGSVKSNIGHTQAAAGAAGVMKMIAAMRAGILPRTLHVDEPTPEVDWASGAVRLLTSQREWPAGGGPRRAAVSSFGISGTNAHVILEEPPHADPLEAVEPAGPVPWVVSGRSAEALKAQASRLADYVSARPALGVVDVGWSLAATRAAFEHRAVVVGRDRAELLAGLQRVTADSPATDVRDGVVLVFPGQGCQWAGMGLDLLSVPVFAGSMHRCAEALKPFTDMDLLQALGDEARLARVEAVQPALWAVMVSLAAWWRSLGVEVAAVVGHSQGEIAAAVVAGALSVEDGARVVALRSGLIARRLSGSGGMASIALPRAAVEARLTGHPGASIAAANGPSATVVSGDPAGLDGLLASCEADGIRVRRIDVDYASHSPHVEMIRDELYEALAGISPQTSEIPFISTVTGGRLDTAELGPEYWYRNLRQPVEFETAVRHLAEQGHETFLECSPHPVLTPGIEETADSAVVLESLRRDEGDLARITTAAGDAWTRGVALDWTPLLPGGRRVPLPTYAFQHRHHWLHAAPGRADGSFEDGHPLLPTAVDLPDGRTIWTGRLSTQVFPWLTDHAVLGSVLLPGAAWAELALHVGHRAGHGRIEELALQTPLLLDDPAQVRVVLEADRRTISMHSKNPDGTWTTHAEGFLGPEGPQPDALTVWPPPGAAPVDLSGFYDELASAGYQYGPSFQALHRAWRADGVLFAEINLPEDIDADGFGIHPGLFDATLHSAACARTDPPERPTLPFAFTGISLSATGSTALRVRLDLHASSWQAWDTDGLPVLTLDQLVTRPVDTGQLTARRPEILFKVTREEVAPATNPASCVILGQDFLTPVFRHAGWQVDTAADLAAVRGAPELVVLPCGRPASTDVLASVRETTGHVLDVLQTWLTDARFDTSHLVVITPEGFVHGPVRSLVRAAQAENPDRITLIDLDDDPASAAVLPGLVAADEPEVVLHAGTGTTPRLVRADRPTGPGSLGDGTVLITGGTGTLGGLLARHIVKEHGVTRLLLAGRTGPASANADGLRAELTGLGAHVDIVAADLSQRPAVAELLAGIDSGHPLSAVVHAAGALDDGILGTQPASWLDSVLRPKADAAWHLHELTTDLPLSAFVLFSSAASVVGAAGQANYAAANGFLDALAAHRRSQGLPGLSLAWGLWEERSGLTRNVGSAARNIAAVGALSTDEALAAFDTALGSNESLLVPIRLDTTVAQDVPPLLRSLVRMPRRTAATAGPAAGERLAGLGAEERRRHVLAVVRNAAAAVLGHDSVHAIIPSRGFLDLGFDSLTAVRLRNRLGKEIGLRLPATTVFDHPTPERLAAYLADELAPTADSTELALERLDALRRTVTGDGLDRALIARRLTALLEELRPPETPPADRETDLDAATADEIYAYIDNELGIGGAP